MSSKGNILGDPEVTANPYCNFAYLYWEGDLQYIFAVTSGSPSTIYHLYPGPNTSLNAMSVKEYEHRSCHDKINKA